MQDEEIRTQQDIAQDVDAVMKKYDRESNTRVWEGVPKQAVRLLSAAFSLYCIWVTLFSTAMPEVSVNFNFRLLKLSGEARRRCTGRKSSAFGLV